MQGSGFQDLLIKIQGFRLRSLSKQNQNEGLLASSILYDACKYAKL